MWPSEELEVQGISRGWERRAPWNSVLKGSRAQAISDYGLFTIMLAMSLMDVHSLTRMLAKKCLCY